MSPVPSSGTVVRKPLLEITSTTPEKNLILSLCSGPELQLLLPPALVGFRALHEGAKGG
jgi:hypothetical protein